MGRVLTFAFYDASMMNVVNLHDLGIKNEICFFHKLLSYFLEKLSLRSGFIF